MKKTLLAIILMWTGASAWAQNMFDALMFSENEYTGTARTMAMGNAFTALGGDLGAVTINPAGSAVAKYSQVSVTPALSISSSTAYGTVMQGYSKPFGFENAMRSNNVNMQMPNIGISFNINTHRTSGVKNISLGFISSVDNTYSGDILAKGTNNTSSIAGALASWAVYSDGTPINPDELWTGNRPYDPYWDYPYHAWDLVTGYNGGIFEEIVETDNAGNSILKGYVGMTENLDENGAKSFGGPISQIYGRTRRGYKRNSIFNFAMNISDILYIGANLSITSLSFSNDWYLKEHTDSPDMFDTGFKELTFGGSTTVKGSGINGKFGFILTPGLGFRIGAAIQTPTMMKLTELYSYNADTKSTDRKYCLNEQSPAGQYSYRLLSPLKFNAGLAWTFGQIGVISADYELSDCNSMNFRNVSTNDMSEFSYLNDQVRSTLGIAHYVRAGLEIKPVKTLSLRAGYGLGTSPEKILEGNTYKYIGCNTHSASLGLGYDSLRSFFLDIACRGNFYPAEYITPYVYNSSNVETPEIKSISSAWLISVTVGFRF
ncbi:MAG: hypothetical protein ACI4TM_03155 [Candidatus Cryptobacteroides sp.]